MLEMAFPDHTGPLLDQRSFHNSYRDYSLYGTYPRKHHGNYQHSSLRGAKPNNNHGATLSNGGTDYSHMVNHSLKGILRNKSDHNGITAQQTSALYEPHLLEDLDASNETYGSQSDLAFGGARPVGVGGGDCGIRRRLQFCDTCALWTDIYLRPMIAEFLAVLLSTFCATFVHFTLFKMQIILLFEISAVALVEGALFTVFFETFHDFKVHLNPAITLGAVFAGSCSLVLCLLFWFAQFLGALLGVLCYQVVAVELNVQIPELASNTQGTWLTSVYQLVLCQGITSAMIVLCYLMDQRESLEDTSPLKGRISRRSSGVGPAVAVGAFISLLASTASWNPVRSLAICLVSTFMGDSVQWSYHYVFWLGPLIGSLFASFFYRILFAEEEKRLVCCRRSKEDSSLV